MIKRKSTKKYYFTVEGETEKWYLDWLKDRINECEEAEFKVSFDAQIQKNPLKRAKSLITTGKTEIWHLSDYESDDPVHVKQFIETMDNMKAAANIGKQITYKFGYTNLTFDLWIILHKASCNGSKAHRKNYITPLNQAYGEKFENMDEYKHEDNFKRCLSQLSLDNVRCAIERANDIMKKNGENGYCLHEYKRYRSCLIVKVRRLFCYLASGKRKYHCLGGLQSRLFSLYRKVRFLSIEKRTSVHQTYVR